MVHYNPHFSFTLQSAHLRYNPHSSYALQPSYITYSHISIFIHFNTYTFQSLYITIQINYNPHIHFNPDTSKSPFITIHTDITIIMYITNLICIHNNLLYNFQSDINSTQVFKNHSFLVCVRICFKFAECLGEDHEEPGPVAHRLRAVPW